VAERCDVAVVGAGPAGAATAGLLAAVGYRVALLDRARFPRRKTCAEYMSPGTEDALVRLGADAAIRGARPLQVRGMEITSPRGRVFRVQYTYRGTARCARTLQRLRLDAALLELAAARGATVHEGTVTREPIVEGGTVQGVRGSASGREIVFRSRLTIIADGAHSTLARSLNIVREPRWPVRLGLVAYYGGNVPLLADYGRMYVARGGYCGVAPLPDGLFNVAVVTHADALARARRSATEFFEDWIGRNPELRDLLADARRESPVTGIVPIGARRARIWTSGALLVGDAAGFFDPFTGEGIFRALRGAEVAADVAHRALERGAAGGEVLGIYADLQRATFRSKEAVSAIVQGFVQCPALLDYAIPRLNAREVPAERLRLALGDLSDAAEFLRPSVLWSALRP